MTGRLPPSLLLALKSKPASFFKKTVRNLLIYGYIPDEELHLLLSACCGVRNLAIYLTWCPLASLLPPIEAMQLQRLNINAPNSFESTPIDLTLPAFIGITHLVLQESLQQVESLYDPRAPAGLTSLPALTHLYLRKAKRAVLREALSACKKLRVLAVTYDKSFPKQICQDLSIDDPRLVLTGDMFNDVPGNFAACTDGGHDLWTRSECFIARKLKGEILPRSRCWIEASDIIL
ncbi:hypothetical protein B0H13DRAFT_2322713 [Mycena leptocephala]|nr:hypothetical protein B0H13DRAFT_2322713 [Mycena leptocephala]